MTPEQAKSVVAPFYASPNQPASKDVRALIEGKLVRHHAEDWAGAIRQLKS